MIEFNSKDELRSVYKAVFKALIIINDLKHTHIAALMGMRTDSFSRWFNNSPRSLAVEEMKLFCDGLKIGPELIDTLVMLSIHFRKSNQTIPCFLTEFPNMREAEILMKQLGNDGYIKILPMILQVITDDTEIAILPIKKDDLSSKLLNNN